MPKYGAEIELLGRIHLVVSGEALARLPSQRLAALLGFLALSKGWVAREKLAEAIWPDMPDGRALASLRNALSVLRRILDPSGSSGLSPIESTRTHCRLSQDVCKVDLWQFDDAISKNEYGSAVALYKGELLPDLGDPWIDLPRDERRSSFIVALKCVADSLLKTDPNGAVAAAKKWLAEEPFETEAIRLLGLGLAAAGQKELGIRVVERFVTGYANEWGESPDLDKNKLYGEIESLGNARPIGRDQVQLRSTVGPEWGASTPRTLPLVVTRFFGREDELEVVLDWACGASRLLTVAGMGGMGKTRLAVEAGERLVAQGERVVFVSLASAESEVAVVTAMLSALELRESEQDSPWTVVRSYIEGIQDRLILILDNVEQVVEVVAPLVLDLLHSNSRLKILNTTRELLAIEGEQLLHLEPFATHAGDPGAFFKGKEEQLDVAVQMFLDRARSTRSDFAITDRNRQDVVALCHELDGLPLAIELIAGWAGTWSVPQMRTHVQEGRLVSRKRGHDSRHQSLQACIDWSFGLLDPATRDFMCMLSLFRGGWTLESAQAVTADPDAPKMLAALLDRSLLSSTDVDDGLRFSMMETVRVFGFERLEEGLARDAAQRFLEFFTNMASRCTNACAGEEEASNHLKLERERENIEAAIALCEAGLASTDDGLKLVGTMPLHWIYRGQWRYGGALIDRMLAIPSDTLSGRGRFLALQGLTVLSQEWGDIARAEQVLSEFRALAENNPDPEIRFRVLTQVGNILNRQGKFAEAIEPHFEALRIASEDGFPRWKAIGNCNLAEALFGVDRVEEAMLHWRRAVDSDRENGNIAGEAMFYLGFVSLIHGDSEEGKEFLSIYLRNAVRLRFRRGCIRSVHFSSLAAAKANALELALSLVACAKTCVTNERIVYDALENKCAEIVNRLFEEAVVDTHPASQSMITLDDAIETTLRFLEKKP